MKLTRAKYDQAWYVLAAVSVSGVLLTSNHVFAASIWAYLTLGGAFVAAAFMTLFIARTNNDADVSEAAALAEETAEPFTGLVMSVSHHESFTVPILFSVQASAESSSDERATTHLAANAEHKGKPEAQIYLKALRPDHFRRRDILQEARELAAHMKDTDFAVHVSADCEIAICERKVSQFWPIVASVKEQDNTHASHVLVN